jgi:hypothetical protein
MTWWSSAPIAAGGQHILLDDLASDSKLVTYLLSTSLFRAATDHPSLDSRMAI